MTADAVGGVWTYALDVAQGLTDTGVRVTLAVLGPRSDTEQRAAAERIGATLIDSGLPLEWTAADAGEVREAALALGRLANDSGADLIHLNSPALAGDAGLRAPVLGVCHSDLASWWAAVKAGPLPEDFRWRTALLGRGYRACDALVAPTAAFAAETARLYGVRPVVVRNGRRAAAASAGSRERAVITSGRLWDEGKNVRTLDAAAERLDAPVLALGSLTGPQGQAVRLEHARALGRVSEAEVGERLAASPVFSSLALYEPFGLGVLEAAQAGCALVLSDISTFRELWDGAAVFTPARDVNAAAAVLQALLDDSAQQARLGAAAAERARCYTVEAMIDGVLAAYADLLAVPAEVAA